MFNNESTLSISVKDKDSIDDYTQILMCIEKGFFYTVGEKPVKMAGSKKWMYQVNAKTDDKGLVVTKSGGNYCFSAKIGGTSLSHVASMSIDENGNGINSLKFIRDNKILLDIQVQEPESGSGPKSYFTMNIKKVYDAKYDSVSGGAEQSALIVWQGVSSEDATFCGTIDLNEEGIELDDGVYEMSFVFSDKSGNDLVYPTNGRKIYFAKNGTEISSLPEPLVSGGGGNGKYTLGWNVPSEKDYNGAVVSYGIKGSAPLGFQASLFPER